MGWGRCPPGVVRLHLSVHTNFCRTVKTPVQCTAEISLDLRTETHRTLWKPGRISYCYNYVGFSVYNCGEM